MEHHRTFFVPYTMYVLRVKTSTTTRGRQQGAFRIPGPLAPFGHRNEAEFLWFHIFLVGIATAHPMHGESLCPLGTFPFRQESTAENVIALFIPLYHIRMFREL